MLLFIQPYFGTILALLYLYIGWCYIMQKYTLEDLKRDDPKLYEEVISIRKRQEERRKREEALAAKFWDMVESSERYNNKK